MEIKRAAVIGSPISHSISPRIFAFTAKLLGRSDVRYEAFQVESTELTAFLGEIRQDSGFVGLNVTLPHKEAVLACADSATPEARAVGAANVLETRDGRLHAHNTDVAGVEETFREQGFAIENTSAWIIGAGGAARAVAFALGRGRAKRVFTSGISGASSLARAESLTRDFTNLFPETEFSAQEPPQNAPSDQSINLVVHSTPLGMRGVPSSRDERPASDVFAALLAADRGFKDTLAFDLIYTSEHTPFLDAARARGLRTVNGLDMLIAQALATWEIWFGPIPPEAVSLKPSLREHLRLFLSEFQSELLNARSPHHLALQGPIFLTGFMGVGKSAIGAALARKLGRTFLDTDRMVENEAGMPISEIFRQSGEPAFREFERRAVAMAAATERTVIALGGGALLHSETLVLVKREGQLVYLAASAAELERRLRAGAERRPLLAGLTSAERHTRIEAMLREREPIYDQADIRVDTDGSNIEKTAAAVEAALSLKKTPPKGTP
jgi:shikimate dehydrogenase